MAAVANTFAGQGAAASITTGQGNCFLGAGAGSALTTESNLILVGRDTGSDAGFANNLVIGANSSAGDGTDTYIGSGMTNGLASATDVTVLGYGCLTGTTGAGGDQTTYIGASITGGRANRATAIGYGVGVFSGTSNAECTIIGAGAFTGTSTADDATVVGYQAQLGTTNNSFNTVAIGTQASGTINTNIRETTVLGYQVNASLGTRTVTMAGGQADSNAASDEALIAVGANAVATGSATAIGADVSNTVANSLVIGDNSNEYVRADATTCAGKGVVQKINYNETGAGSITIGNDQHRAEAFNVATAVTAAGDTYTTDIGANIDFGVTTGAHWFFTIQNRDGADTITLAAAASGVTLSGVTTVAAGQTRRYLVRKTGADTVTIYGLYTIGN